MNIPKKLRYEKGFPFQNTSIYFCCCKDSIERYPGNEHLSFYVENLVGASDKVARVFIVDTHLFTVVWACPHCFEKYWFHCSEEFLEKLIAKIVKE
jgi:hypothetical protein